MLFIGTRRALPFRAIWSSIGSAKLRPTNCTDSGRPLDGIPAIIGAAIGDFSIGVGLDICRRQSGNDLAKLDTIVSPGWSERQNPRQPAHPR
jgi:hypothetical protein